MSFLQDGDTAFPQLDITERGICIPTGGMSLRDYFAAKAMLALVSNLEEDEIDSHKFEKTVQWISKSSYFMADEMLKERMES